MFVGTSLWEVVKSHMERYNISEGEFKERCQNQGLGYKTIDNWKNMARMMNNGATGNVRESNIEVAARVLGISYFLLKNDINKSLQMRKNSQVFNSNFYSMFSWSNKMDSTIMPIIRSVSSTPIGDNDDIIYEAYDKLVQSDRFENDIKSNLFIENISNEYFMDELIQNMPSPKLEIDIEKNLESMLFRIKDYSLKVNNPELIWDCPCIKNSVHPKCPFHGENKHELNEVIEKLFKGENPNSSETQKVNEKT